MIETEHGVLIVGYTDFPSRMATQSSSLYATNLRHMMDDLTPEKDGEMVINMEDDVIRGVTAVHQGEITFPPPPPKIQAIGKPAAEPTPEPTAEEKRAAEMAAMRRAGQQQTGNACHWWRAYDGNRCLCACQLYAAFHRLCTSLLCRLPGDLECKSCTSHAAHGCDKCDLWHHYFGLSVTD